jgi:hypothetical protein
MAVSVKIYDLFEADIGGEIKAGGSVRTARTIALTDDDVHEKKATIANAATPNNFKIVTMWDSSVDPLTSYRFGWIETDAAILIEFRDGAKFSIRELAANGRMILDSDSMDNVTLVAADTVHGTMGDVDRIRVKNNVTLTTANVRLVLMT